MPVASARAAPALFVDLDRAGDLDPGVVADACGDVRVDHRVGHRAAGQPEPALAASAVATAVWLASASTCSSPTVSPATWPMATSSPMLAVAPPPIVLPVTEAPRRPRRR